MKNSDVKICIISEGYEEHEYLQKIISLNKFSKKYHFKLINAKSINSVFPRYQSHYSSNSYDLVIIFCDTDLDLTKYQSIKTKINEFHDCNVSDDVLYFSNPCTMQIMLSHFKKVSLSSQSKKVNAEIIKECTGISNYDAHEEQRKEFFSKINRTNYKVMKQNIEFLSNDYTKKPSTNFLKLLKNLESDDTSWVEEITVKL